MRVSVIIPALNEEQSIGHVLDDIPREYSQDVIVVDNGSSDQTAAVAASHGARVVREPQRGYGRACLRGLAEIQQPDVVVFLDADYSDFPNEMPLLVEPIVQDSADLVLGSRLMGRNDEGAVPPHAAFGNKLAGGLMRLLFKHRYTDLGPFRAIRHSALQSLQMRDPTYGWTVEMQIKAIKQRLRILEVPVSYRKRIGKSKVSGTIAGSLKAGFKIIWTIFKYASD